MGYSQCSVPGCNSKVGKGLYFKSFPRNNPELARKWMEVVPVGFRVTSNSAVCELHFTLLDFEKVRADGKKKIRALAVPSVFPERLPLGEIRGQKLCNSQTHTSVPLRKSKGRKALSPTAKKSTAVVSDHSYSVNNSEDVENVPPKDTFLNDSLYIVEDDEDWNEPSSAVQLFNDVNSIETCSTPFSNERFLEEIYGAPNANSSLLLSQDCDSKVSDCDNTSNVNCKILNETLPGCDEISRVDCDNSNVTAPAMGEIFVDKTSENNELFIDLSSVTQLDIFEMLQQQQAKIDQLVNRNKEIVSENLRLQQQDAKIAQLVKRNEEILSENLRLQHQVTRATLLRKRHQALKKVTARLKTKVQSRRISPWLTESQQKMLLRTSNRGVTFEPELVRQGLIHKMKCGTKGYHDFVSAYPLLPSVRTLQAAVQFIKFQSGLLDEVFDLLRVFSDTCPDLFKDCHIVLDEMAIEEGLRYDPSTKTYIGECTFPTHSGRATKGLVIMLAGVTKRWKIPVAVYLTKKRDDKFKKKAGEKDENKTGVAFAEILTQVIVRTETIGLRVSGITSDMGPDNLAFWRAFGVTGGKSEAVKTSISNPVRPDDEVFIMPDPVHLEKAIKSALESNEIFTLPKDIVEQEKLPSAVVDYNHIDDLYNYEADCELKVAFRLKPENIHCNKQFSKMNVGNTSAVVCHRTGVGLKLLAEKKNNPSYLTTAWFILLLNTFFELVTCKGGKLALSMSNEKVYNEAIELIKKMDYIFQNMTIGKDKRWKPCQRGMRVLCASLLGLQERFLKKMGRAFLLLGRFTQDCLENLFSLIRLRQATPHAVAFFQCLKVITMSQYSIAIKGSSYKHEECEPIPGFDFLAEAKRRAVERAEARSCQSLEELQSKPIEKLSGNEIKNRLSEWEQCVLYDIAGGVVRSLHSRNISVCQNCTNALKLEPDQHHPLSIVTSMKEFTAFKSDAKTGRSQIYVTDKVYKVFLCADVTFRKYRQNALHFKSADVIKYFVDNLMYAWDGVPIPDCHNVKRHLLEFFIALKVKEFSRVLGRAAKTQKEGEVNRSSKSVGMRDAANKILSVPKKA